MSFRQCTEKSVEEPFGMKMGEFPSFSTAGKRRILVRIASVDGYDRVQAQGFVVDVSEVLASLELRKGDLGRIIVGAEFVKDDVAEFLITCWIPSEVMKDWEGVRIRTRRLGGGEGRLPQPRCEAVVSRPASKTCSNSDRNSFGFCVSAAIASRKMHCSLPPPFVSETFSRKPLESASWTKWSTKS